MILWSPSQTQAISSRGTDASDCMDGRVIFMTCPRLNLWITVPVAVPGDIADQANLWKKARV